MFYLKEWRSLPLYDKLEQSAMRYVRWLSPINIKKRREIADKKN